MTKLPFCGLVLTLAICIVAFRGAEKEIVVREVVGNEKLKPGQLLTERKEIRTAEGARLQLDVGRGVFRIGANSVVQINGSTHLIELQSGSSLFDSLSDDAPLAIQLGNEKLTVRQGTGFAHKLEDDPGQPRVVIGSIGGKTKVALREAEIVLKPGELLVAASDGSLARANFDLAQQVKSSVLVNGFTSSLPNQREVKKEVARFAAFEKRGFVRVLRRGNVASETSAEVQGQTRRTVAQLGIEELPNETRIAGGARPTPGPGGGFTAIMDVSPRPGGGGGARDDDDGPRPRPVPTKPGGRDDGDPRPPLAKPAAKH